MQSGSTYHVFNHANGKENLFAENKNYDFFLGRLSLHLLPVAHIYAYCLMPNHFHLLLKIRNERELITYFAKKKNEELLKRGGGVRQTDNIEKMNPNELSAKISKSFSNLFNSYAQAFNKMYNRKGSLFMLNMKREEVKTDDSFCRVVRYIHRNPVHHGFVNGVDKWQHSSYKIFLSQSATKLERDYVLKVFGGLESFIKYHQAVLDEDDKWIDS